MCSFQLWTRSLTITENNTGPNFVPWGMPPCRYKGAETEAPTRVTWALPCKKDATHLRKRQWSLYCEESLKIKNITGVSWHHSSSISSLYHYICQFKVIKQFCQHANQWKIRKINLIIFLIKVSTYFFCFFSPTPSLTPVCSSNLINLFSLNSVLFFQCRSRNNNLNICFFQL